MARAARHTACAFLHGFASSPLSTKGQALKARVPHVVLPDLNHPSFAQLTYTGAMKAVSEALATSGPNQQPWLLAGSSMGGYIAALYASVYPTHVSRLVLLCPGFALVDRWESVLPAGAMDAWQREGSLAFADGQGIEVPVHWGFMEDARMYPRFPVVQCPTLIVHGIRDDVVPVDTSRKYAQQHSDLVRLVEVDDDHALTGDLPALMDTILEFWGEGSTQARP